MSDILIVENRAIYRHGLRLLVKKNFPEYKLTVTGKLDTLPGESSLYQPSIVIYGVGARQRTNEQLVKLTRLISHFPLTRILIFSTHQENYLVREYFRAGVQGYVLLDDQDLIEGIKNLIGDKKFISPNTLVSLVTAQSREQKHHASNNS